MADDVTHNLCGAFTWSELKSAHPLSQSADREAFVPLESKVLHIDLTYRIIGAAKRVHTRLGPGLKERHYQRALFAEMIGDGLQVSDEYHLEIYDGETCLCRLYLDHWVEEKVVVEVESFPHLL
ncbi:MAG: GxxExxY protein, partial [Anaerolineales bacterium]